MQTTTAEASSPPPAHVSKRSTSLLERALAALLVTAGVAFGLANGIMEGRTWAEAAEIEANWSHAYGSLAWMDQIAAVIVLCLAGGFIALVGGTLAAVLPSAHRRALLWTTIAAVFVGSFVGFIGLTGVGREQGFDPADVFGLVVGMGFCTALGGGIGYVIGSVLVAMARRRTGT